MGSDTGRRIDVRLVGLSIALAGALVMVVAVFLPRLDTSGSPVADNTLLAGGEGWWFLGLAVLIAVTASGAYVRGYRQAAVLVLALVAIALAIYEGTNDEGLTLIRLSEDVSEPPREVGKASPGVGIYLAGAGGVLALAGGLVMRVGAWRQGLEGPKAPRAEPGSAAPWTCDLCGAVLPGHEAALEHVEREHPEVSTADANATVRPSA